MRVSFLIECLTTLIMISAVHCELPSYRSTLNETQNMILDQMFENFSKQEYNETMSTNNTEIEVAGSTVTYNYCVGGFLLALSAARGQAGNKIENLIDTCNWTAESANGRKCAKHAVEAAGAIGLTWMVGASINGRTVVSRILGQVSQMNELTGNQELGNLARRDLDTNGSKGCVNCNSCPRDLVNTAGDTGVTFSNSDYGLITTCESSCQISQVNSEVSEVLGKMATDVINQKLTDVQYTVTLPNKKAVTRCNIFIAERPQPPCPKTVTGKGCQTKIRGC